MSKINKIIYFIISTIFFIVFDSYFSNLILNDLRFKIPENKIMDLPIDYKSVNERLNIERERSQKWLENALNKPVRKTSASELLLWKCLEHDKAIYEANLAEMREAIKTLTSRLDELEKK